MLTKYCFHLGREQELSLEELRAFFGDGVDHRGEVALVDHEPFEDPQAVLDQLGGCTKLSEVFIETDRDRKAILPELINKLESIKPEGKVHFGLNIFPENERALTDLLKKVKDEMKTLERNARFLNQHTNLNTATIVKGGLMKDGTDLNICDIGEQRVALTQTVAVQDFVGYSLRDYEKPRRLKREGMLPPKLAQMMINFTALVTQNTDFEGKTLYDPFSGSGTVLGEAFIKGMNVIGSDLSPTAIEAANENLDWIQDNQLAPTTLERNLFIQDAQHLSTADLPTPPDMVVSELYLGPPVAYKIHPHEVNEIQRDLIPLYHYFLRSLRPLLKAKTPLILALPVHFSAGGFRRLPIEQILPPRYKFIASLTYHRKDQAVGRDIWILEATEDEG